MHRLMCAVRPSRAAAKLSDGARQARLRCHFCTRFQKEVESVRGPDNVAQLFSVGRGGGGVGEGGGGVDR